MPKRGTPRGPRGKRPPIDLPPDRARFGELIVACWAHSPLDIAVSPHEMPTMPAIIEIRTRS